MSENEVNDVEGGGVVWEGEQEMANWLRVGWDGAWTKNVANIYGREKKMVNDGRERRGLRRMSDIIVFHSRRGLGADEVMRFKI